ncbi:hypothetical protein MPER_01909, partial [Moniliophthora perniciosa FA553]
MITHTTMLLPREDPNGTNQLKATWINFEGKEERETAYKPMKDALLDHFSDIPERERRNFRVLVPGAGLARLAYDVASLGFAVKGTSSHINTFSFLPDSNMNLRSTSA